MLDPDDVLGVLGLTPGERRARRRPGRRRRHPGGAGGAAALGGEPATVDELTAAPGSIRAPVAVAVAGLVRSGHLRRAHGLLWPA